MTFYILTRNQLSSLNMQGYVDILRDGKSIRVTHSMVQYGTFSQRKEAEKSEKTPCESREMKAAPARQVRKKRWIMARKRPKNPDKALPYIVLKCKRSKNPGIAHAIETSKKIKLSDTFYFYLGDGVAFNTAQEAKDYVMKFHGRNVIIYDE